MEAENWPIFWAQWPNLTEFFSLIHSKKIDGRMDVFGGRFCAGNKTEHIFRA